MMYSQRVSIQSSTNGGNYIITNTTAANDSYANIGGPTQTTSTLTPTTLKNIEESFMEISAIPLKPLEHQHQAGFVPPQVNIPSAYVMHQTAAQNYDNDNSDGNDYDDSDMSDDDSRSSQSQSCWMIEFGNKSSDSNGGITNVISVKTGEVKSKRGTCGRKPSRNVKLTPEEEQKRYQRRERNKQAAARCRKRRMDHTNTLLRETDGLEEKKLALESEIEELRSQKEELEYILETHKVNCKMNNKVIDIDIKPKVLNLVNSSNNRSRPNSLPVPCVYSNNNYDSQFKNNMNDTGIPIQTPSNGLFFDAILESGTGLTPILNGTMTPSVLALTPSTTIALSSCSGQQRNLSSPNSEMSSPEKSVKLVPL